MLAVALGLAERGFKVFPIRAGEKKPPLIKDWEILATSDPAQIRSWWTQWPQANVGIHCEGMLVLDVDAQKGGFESLAALEKEIELEATYEVETPRGGRHIYYRCTDAISNGVDVLGSGIDVRTMGGYVVGAGSRTTAEYRVVADEPLADADPRLVDRCRPKPRLSADPRPDVSTDRDAAVARATAYLRTHPVAVEGNGGDHHTFRTICRIRDFGVDRARAAEALEEWNARCEPPWAPEELEVKIANAYAYAQDAAGKLTPEALGFEKVAESSPELSENDRTQTADDRTQEADDAELLHPADVGLAEVLQVEYLIKGVLERQSNAVLFGQWNVGKTFVILDMAAAIATGQPWFGKRVRQGRVLYVGYEGIRAMRKRILALREKHPMLKDRATPFAWAPLRYPLTSAEGKTEMKKVLRRFGKVHQGPPALIVIDPLANALGGDDADATLMAQLNTEVSELMRVHKCTVLRVHHSGHGNQDRARGHSSLPAGVDTEIRVDKQEIALTKQRDDVRGRFGFNLKVVDVGTDTDGDKVTTCVVVQIEDNALSPELTGPQREFLDALIKRRGDGGYASATDAKDCAPTDMTPAQRRSLLAVLETKQYLRVEGKGWVIVERGPMAIFD
jgi:hypothetical protein